MPTATDTIEALATQEYKYGFVTEIETESVPKGLNVYLRLEDGVVGDVSFQGSGWRFRRWPRR